MLKLFSAAQALMGSVAYMAQRIVANVLIVDDSGSSARAVQRAMSLAPVYTETLIHEVGRLDHGTVCHAM